MCHGRRSAQCCWVHRWSARERHQPISERRRVFGVPLLGAACFLHSTALPGFSPWRNLPFPYRPRGGHTFPLLTVPGCLKILCEFLKPAHTSAKSPFIKSFPVRPLTSINRPHMHICTVLHIQKCEQFSCKLYYFLWTVVKKVWETLSWFLLHHCLPGGYRELLGWDL